MKKRNQTLQSQDQTEQIDKSTILKNKDTYSSSIMDIEPKKNMNQNLQIQESLIPYDHKSSSSLH